MSMCVEEQDILGSPESLTKFLAIIPDELLRQEVQKQLQRFSTSRHRWEAFVSLVRDLRSKVRIQQELFSIKIVLGHVCQITNKIKS